MLTTKWWQASRAAKARGVPLKVIRDSYHDGRTAYEAELMLGGRPLCRLAQ